MAEDDPVGCAFPPVPGSQSGYTIVSGAPVVVKDWTTEQRFAQSRRCRTSSARAAGVVGGDRQPPRPVRRARSCSPVRGAHTRAATSTSSRPWRTCSRTRSSDRRPRTGSATGRSTTRSPVCPNRVLFLDRLDQALSRQRRSKSAAAVLFLDLDHFKLVNDSLGHQVGDELLAAVAPRIKRRCARATPSRGSAATSSGSCSRTLSGDREAVDTAQRIAAVFTRPFVLAGREHFVTTSIGIAIARGGEHAEELIRDADAAMYRAKEHGRARYELFDEVMRGRAIARLRVENDLRRALERDELALDYQPVVIAPRPWIVSVEALVRWEHPSAA